MKTKHQDLINRLEGCVYTVFTPFNNDHEIDYATLDKYIKFLYNSGARKFYLMAYNSRFSQLNESEIYELNRFVTMKAKSINPNNLVIVAEPIHCSTATSIDFAIHAREVGADLISLIFREKFFSDEQVIEHFQKIGKQSKMPILIHEMPFLSGFDGSQIHWPQSLIRKISSIEQVVAIKEDAKNDIITKSILKLEPNIRVIISGGGKQRLLKFKKYGVKSYLNGISMIDARIGETFWNAWKNNNNEKINYIIKNFENPFFNNAVKKYGWHRTNKALLQAAGLMHRRDRMPLKHLSNKEFEDIKVIYKKIKKNMDKFFK